VTAVNVTTGRWLAVPPRALIVTVFGLYAREHGGWLGVGAVVRLMACLDVDESAVRSSISRLKRREVIRPHRVDGVAGYRVADPVRQLLELGDRRIFDRPSAALDDGWVLAVFSVPEAERNKRHRLRSRLAWLGFGAVGAGVWIAPGHLEHETREVLATEDLSGYVELFHADYLGFGDPHEKVSAWWNLADIDARYAQFHAAHARLLARWRARPRRREFDQAAFADYIRTLTAWRRLPYLDPGLPRELLPRQWAGTDAARTFHAIRSRLEAPAHRFVVDVIDGRP
jgi:phenylacetic acid degradation operon negative regulatory protein